MLKQIWCKVIRFHQNFWFNSHISPLQLHLNQKYILIMYLQETIEIMIFWGEEEVIQVKWIKYEITKVINIKGNSMLIHLHLLITVYHQMIWNINCFNNNLEEDMIMSNINHLLLLISRLSHKGWIDLLVHQHLHLRLFLQLLIMPKEQ